MQIKEDYILVCPKKSLRTILVDMINQFYIKSYEMPLSDQRFFQLTEWVRLCLDPKIQLQLISGDASFRRYFRFEHNNQSYIAVDSPPDLVPILPFVELAQSYHQSGLKTPEVLHQNEQLGFMVLTDLGDNMLNSALNEDTVIPLYQQAIELLPLVAKVQSTAKHQLPAFDQAFISTELAIFNDWLLKEHLSYSLDESTQKMLLQVFDTLTKTIVSQPQVAMHRDYHSRNIMLHNQQMYLIDFQDSVMGPISYDAVSLLRDCYVVWPSTMVDALAKYHFEQCLKHGLLSANTQFEQYQYWFDLTGMQRHLKIAGIFARLHHRDGKSGYLTDIPQSLHYLIEVGNRYTEFSELVTWLKQDILPKVEATL
ncbi:aminoglycoside phosphotransferase family protein [Parashewanella tropica]|uniref:aminoglycoside phosphotransferase family protein n=1 Tax=Parashewanella tropica TaxID=2547970 RepID=UPI001FE5D9CF|nr:phosphotransferase [Parashewanella tropica]